MQQVVIPKAGPTSILQIQEKTTPTPTPNEVLIEVAAFGINFADIMARKGLYPDAPPFPCVVGYEVAGTITAVGENVNNVKEGDRVLAMTRFGGNSTHVVVPSNQVYSIPDQLDFNHAASIPVVYATAWALLIAMGSLREGDTLLIQNAGGGVGLAAIDIAKHIGARTLGTASAKKHTFLQERGLDIAIDYRTSDFEDEVLAATNGKGVELIIDPLGGEYWKRNYKMLRSTGNLGLFGASTMTESASKFGALLTMARNMPLYNPVQLMNANKGVFGVNMGHMWDESDKVGIWIQKILDGYADGWVRPHVDKTFPLQDIAAAHQYIEDRKNMGKVIITTT